MFLNTTRTLPGYSFVSSSRVELTLLQKGQAKSQASTIVTSASGEPST